ncbi:sulfate transporter [Mycobacterium rhizamassiliense]|uniref:Sulfate transporter n=1 Tax=Mycobacterium rhizamassiliense TaxID=1841860 RepID=A0A2U3NLN4_9MYCO|nr:STAS domain-containing protein [Mycobacterium rhizamassiliense]SPM32432.1 sulfate transporter [Mycobacterium rhizamassiliense]
MTESSTLIQIEAERHDQVAILAVSGVLDSATYRELRDAVIKAALEEPRAVVVDVNYLVVPFESAWSAFTSARWHVSTWPDVPILLVCEDQHSRRAIISVGVTRYVPVHRSRESAVDAVGDRSLDDRRWARTELPPRGVSVSLARALIRRWLAGWAQSHLIPVAGTVATVFIENVLEHTDSAPVLIVENHRDTITVAVEDHSTLPASRIEDAESGADILSGLAIVAALSRAWGSSPTSSGKTVWATVGRENQL